MATKYHINQTTGQYGKCTAEKKECPLSGTHIHLTKLADAIEYSSMILEEKHGAVSTLKKKKTVKPEDVKLEINNDFPYPTANKLDKIDYVVHGIREGRVNSSVVATMLGAKDRVGDYYGEAACFLGLADAVTDRQGNKAYSLTQNGSDYLQQDKAGRELILRNAVENIPLVQKMRNNESEEEMVKYVSSTHNESEGTADRKVSSIRSWVGQIDKGEFLNDVKKEDVEEKVSEGIGLYERKIADRPEVVVEKVGEICPNCFMAKSLTGVCDNCDD